MENLTEVFMVGRDTQRSVFKYKGIIFWIDEVIPTNWLKKPYEFGVIDVNIPINKKNTEILNKYNLVFIDTYNTANHGAIMFKRQYEKTIFDMVESIKFFIDKEKNNLGLSRYTPSYQ